jgi:hypothetical protein
MQNQIVRNSDTTHQLGYRNFYLYLEDILPLSTYGKHFGLRKRKISRLST